MEADYKGCFSWGEIDCQLMPHQFLPLEMIKTMTAISLVSTWAEWSRAVNGSSMSPPAVVLTNWLCSFHAF